MNKIKVLSQKLINLIAAGEVVERPASVIKELLENSIDAKSQNIIINIEDAGFRLINVKDDGIGMSLEDSKLALTQHATSKISSEEDLNKILTLGFRGEALASISEVSEETIIESKSKSTNAAKVIYKNQKIMEGSSTRITEGTEISIINLFKNIPARKKFLKSENTELKHILSTFLQIALPHINIHFEIYSNKKLVYRLTKTKDIKDRIYEIWGENITNNLYFNNTNLQNFKIKGYIGNTQSGKTQNPLQFLYINSRYLKSNTVSAAISKGYEGFLHKNLKPNYFIFLEIEPSQVDINIHPRKLEVKFENEQEIFLNIYKFIKTTLEKESRSYIKETLQDTKYNNPSAKSHFQYISPTQNSSKIKETSIKSYAPQINRIERITQALDFTKEILRTDSPSIKNEDTTFKPEKVIQIFNTYIAFEKENKLVIIDQHAAAEKIAFEKIMTSLNKAVITKPLLVPELIDLANSAEKQELLEKKENLQKVGLKIEDFGGNTIQITEIPEVINKPDFRNIIEEILNNENVGIKTDEGTLDLYTVSRDMYLMVATLACHGSIRAGQKLSETEMFQIITDLSKVKNPGNCPHGRPTTWEISKYDFEKNFKRNI